MRNLKRLNRKPAEVMGIFQKIGWRKFPLGAIRILRHTHGGVLLINIVNRELDLWQTQTLRIIHTMRR